jgi:hypothetical protein
VTSTPNSSLLTTTFTGLTITCPFGEPNTGTSSCLGFSNPQLQNNVIWQNRSFYIGVGSLGQGNLNQQKLVSLFDAFTGTAAPVQTVAGQCGTASYWDIGVRGDTGPSNHGSGFTLSPTYSVLDDPTDYSTGSNSGSNPSVVSQYCNGARVPPECTVADGCGGPSGYGVPPGIVDASTPNPIFSLTPAATVDEGNNWINVSWGPLALSNPALNSGTGSTGTGNWGSGPLFGNYALNAGSPAINYVPVAQLHPPTDFFGNPRPDSANATAFDVGAIEFGSSGGGGGGTASVTLSAPVPALTTTPANTATKTGTITVTNAGTATAAFTFTAAPAVTKVGTAGGTFSIATGGTCANDTILDPGGTCTINVQYAPGTSTATASANVTATGAGGATLAITAN